MVPIINCLTSIFAGFVVFSVLGHIAHVEHTTVANVTKGGEYITSQHSNRTNTMALRHIAVLEQTYVSSLTRHKGR